MVCRKPTSLFAITWKRALETLPIFLKRPVMLYRSASKTICKEIVDEMNQQQFGLVVGQVTNDANWEQSGIAVWYFKDDRPTERLLEYIKCPNIHGATIANLIITVVNEVGLNIKKYSVQTYDGAGNVTGKQQGDANQLKLKTDNVNATYFHCVSHELNLAFSKLQKLLTFTTWFVYYRHWESFSWTLLSVNRSSRDASKATWRWNNLTQ